MSKAKIVSALAYSKIRGCSEFTVRSAIDRGILKTAVVQYDKPEKGNAKILIDVEKANEEWPVSPREMDSKKSHQQDKIDDAEADLEAFKDEIGSDNDRLTQASVAVRYNLARALREEANAKLADIKQKQAAGELVEVAKIRDIAFKAGRVVRDQVLTIPDRVSADLAAETNQYKVYLLLTNELKNALASLEDVLKEI